ncbi:hypothetical protein QBC34DRAFT_360213 [Podospora aff. communis PSN243]|uniref:Uncharacterized protein n=1 Tax=Podospora aff. communis PSN243 TaxID=3040156 RepID=A0AAV9G9G3_9PEZI|nr:hypothetical protein QBC34DRAFT_360213 [Podospora aff. communis PSN243]
MSSSATTTTLQQEHLRDYTIRLTGGSEVATPEPFPVEATAARVENPPDWETEFREVPPYRPVNRQLDREERPWGSNAVENAIIYAMFQGVWLKSTASWLWRQTGGRFDKEAFTATIGGES